MTGQPTEHHSPLEVTEVDGWPMVKCSCDADQGVRWHSAHWLTDHWQGDQASGVAAIHAAIDRQRGAWLDEADTADRALSGQPTEADIAAMLADALHREFGAFLAHDPHDADRFWGSTARSVAAALRPLLTDTADARVTVAGSGRPSNDRDGACICDYNPETTEGPEEDCPFHGRPYAYWVERADTADARAAGAREDAAWVELDRRLAAEQRLAAVLDVVEMYESCGPKQQSTRDVLAAVRAALAADTVTDTSQEET